MKFASFSGRVRILPMHGHIMLKTITSLITTFAFASLVGTANAVVIQGKDWLKLTTVAKLHQPVASEIFDRSFICTNLIVSFSLDRLLAQEDRS